MNVKVNDMVKAIGSANVHTFGNLIGTVAEIDHKRHFNVRVVFETYSPGGYWFSENELVSA